MHSKSARSYRLFQFEILADKELIFDSIEHVEPIEQIKPVEPMEAVETADHVKLLKLVELLEQTFRNLKKTFKILQDPSKTFKNL